MDLFEILQDPNNKLLDIFNYICFFMDSIYESSSDKYLLEVLPFFSKYSFLSIPEGISEDFIDRMAFLKKL